MPALVNIICLPCPGKTLFYHNFFIYIECPSDIFCKNFINNSNSNNNNNNNNNNSNNNILDFCKK